MQNTEGALCAYHEPAPAEPSEPQLYTTKQPAANARVVRRHSRPAAVMAGIIQGPARGPPRPLKPALLSILDACAYLGGVSRAKFYADILPKLETVKLGRRNFIVVASMDRLIEANRRPAE